MQNWHLPTATVPKWCHSRQAASRESSRKGTPRKTPFFLGMGFGYWFWYGRRHTPKLRPVSMFSKKGSALSKWMSFDVFWSLVPHSSHLLKDRGFERSKSWKGEGKNRQEGQVQIIGTTRYNMNYIPEFSIVMGQKSCFFDHDVCEIFCSLPQRRAVWKTMKPHSKPELAVSLGTQEHPTTSYNYRL